MIKVGFIGAVSKEWMGGLNYFNNLLFAIDSLNNKELQIFVFVGKKTDEDIKNMFRKYATVIEDRIFDRKSLKWFLMKLEQKIFKTNFLLENILKKYDVHALTDVTGFGLLVHLNEMLDEKNSAVIYKDSIPYFDDCQKYVEEFYLSGAAQTNRNSVEGKIYFDCDFFTEEILFDPQTSGGLLASVAKEDLEKLEKDFKENNLELYVVGEVIDKNEYNVYVR